MVAAHPTVFEEARGEGLLMGVKCQAANLDVVAAARRELLLTVPAGDNVVRLLPPLNVTDEEIERTLNEWSAEGWKFDSIQFAMREASKRPAMAFVLFTRATPED